MPNPVLGALCLLTCLIFTTGGWVPEDINISAPILRWGNYHCKRWKMKPKELASFRSYKWTLCCLQSPYSSHLPLCFFIGQDLNEWLCHLGRSKTWMNPETWPGHPPIFSFIHLFVQQAFVRCQLCIPLLPGWNHSLQGFNHKHVKDSHINPSGQNVRVLFSFFFFFLLFLHWFKKGRERER